jgi:signal transduction histidine kinase
LSFTGRIIARLHTGGARDYRDHMDRKEATAGLLRPLGGLAALHAVACVIGIQLTVAPGSASAFWPAAGTLAGFLLIHQRSRWAALCTVAFAVEVIVLRAAPYAASLAQCAGIGAVNIGQALLLAWIARPGGAEPLRFDRVVPMLRFWAAAAASTLAGSILGARAVTGAWQFEPFFANQQAWWMSGFLGVAVITPLVVSWTRLGIARDLRIPRVEAARVTLMLGALFVVLVYAFWRAPGPPRWALDSPALAYPLLLWIACTAGTRRTTLAVLAAAAIAAGFTVQGLGPFGHLETIFGAVGRLQGYLVLVVVPVLVVHAVFAERRDALHLLARSEARYRAFVENTSETIFRVDLQRPASQGLAGPEQWSTLERDGTVALGNRSYRSYRTHGSTVPADDAAVPLRDAPSWLRQCLRHACEALFAGRGENGIESSLEAPGLGARTLVVSLTPEVRDGALHGVWGLARDVTEMRDAERRLLRKELELRALATELTLAEERARRRIASDLHDGLAQTLVGAQLQLASLRARVGRGEDAAALEQVESALAAANAHTRAVMSELLPPGLYDRGLGAGIEWLAQQAQERDGLTVVVDLRDRPPLGESATLLLFQAVRELLQNALRHGAAKAVTVRARLEGGRYVLEVEDQGRGFDTGTLASLPSRRGGFGLFSIRERLKMIGGQVDVRSTPGAGTLVRITAPLDVDRGLYDEALRA